MTGFETARTVRYTGPDPDEIQRAFAADSERAFAAGYVVTRTRWERSQGQPILVVDYLHASVDQRAGRPTGAQPPAAGSGPGARRPHRGLGEALLVAGGILAAIIVLAVAIPTAAPAPAPSPASPAPSPAAALAAPRPSAPPSGG